MAESAKSVRRCPHTRACFCGRNRFRKLRFCMPAPLPAQFVSALCPIRCPCMVCSACRKMKGGAFLAKFKTRLPSGCFLIGIQALIDYAGRQESNFVEPIPQKLQTNLLEMPLACSPASTFYSCQSFCAAFFFATTAISYPFPYCIPLRVCFHHAKTGAVSFLRQPRTWLIWRRMRYSP